MSLRSLFLAFVMLPAMLIAEEKEVNYIPQVHGALRTRFEYEFDSDIKRFQVANARVTLAGMISPRIDYFVQIDACDRGKMKFLDGYGRLAITDNFKFQAGQFREPFGVETFRSPANYVFANRAFLGKVICNYRGVGAKLTYTLPKVPLTFEAGGFNTTTIADHTVKNTLMAFASKILWQPKGWTLATGFMSQAPQGKRFNMFDLTVGWKNEDWEFLGEGMIKHYSRSVLDGTYSYVVWGQRLFPVNWGMFNQASLQARFDGMTHSSNGLRDERTGDFVITDSWKNRITVGGTVTYKYKWVHADVRLNYEKYFYHKGVTAPESLDDKIVAELVIRF